MILWGRNKYEALLGFERDGELTNRERAFMARFRAKHPECASFEGLDEQGFDLLRGLALDADHDVPVQFEKRVIRKWRVQSVRDTASYWSPAICGAVVAAVALLAAFQLLGRSSEMKPISVTGSEVRRTEPAKPVFPDVGLAGDSALSQ